ncbi:MAG: polymer-forming cytoskeletal protein [Chloroflexota bacterium]|nr:polymer-forming cytoskeletal protein [Chloroflexota bacterium]
MRTPFHATPPTPDFQPPRPAAGDRPAVRHPGLSPIRHADGGIGARSGPTSTTNKEESPMPYDADVVAAAPRATRPDAPTPDERRPAAEATFLDRHTTIEGTLRSAKDLRIEGRVEGDVVCEGKLTIAEGAVVQARIEAADVLISGSVEGDVHSHGSFSLQPSAVIRGSATAARITIEDGASYEGELHMASGPPRTPDTAPTPLEGVIAGRAEEPAAGSGNGSRRG